MFILKLQDLVEFEESLGDGYWLAQFEISEEKDRGEMIEVIEKIFDIAEKADKLVSEMLFGDGQSASKLAGKGQADEEE